MRKSLANKKNGLSVLIALILGIITASVNAQTTRNEKEHIEVNIHDSSGKIVRSGAGECWHTHFGVAEGECDKSMPIAETVAPAPIDKPTPIAPPIQIEKPVAVPVLPIVTTKKITLEASEFFDFGEPILRPSARAELDDFVEKLKDTNPQTIKVIGHADRFGSAHYNQILSEQRAATVKAYLVRKGVSPDIVVAEGKGDTQPITKKDQCPDDKTPQAIACLQPDRRVEIEVTGTKMGP
ncbi:MAG: OmpA family protein [Candidatus Nitrotoga sp.]|nr:OmpA family protein [Candidatus Nitrotoga sp.]